jgi:hypothetical protein
MDKLMTKSEALKAMFDGEKVTHRNFTPDEWMCKSDIGYKFEDGCLCSYEEFWQFRDDDSWEDGWKIYK